MNKKKQMVLNGLFVLASLGLLLFLLTAPPETTPFMPNDEDHASFIQGSKKTAEKHCASCHAADQIAPLPEGHSTLNRCLFCHKRPYPSREATEQQEKAER